jgi:hemerythrin
MALIDLEAIPRVFLAFMNDDHREEARLLNAAVDALDAERRGAGDRAVTLAAFDRFVEHTREHFGREEVSMRDAAFPPYPVHKAEHDRVLAELSSEVEQYRAGGDAERLRRYAAEAVPAWFLSHIDSMDMVTSRFVASRRGQG